MDEFDQLDLVAQIAATLLGFIAIFLALSKPDGRFPASDRHFIQALVMSTTAAIIFSIAPRSINLFFTSESIWRASSVMAIVLGAPVVFLQAQQQIRMSRDEAAQIDWFWHLGAWFLAIASSAMFLLALFDGVRTAAYYVGGVSILVPLSLWVFIGVVFRRFF